MILSDKILIPTSCPLNFKDNIVYDNYNLRCNTQKWCVGDPITVQVRSEYYTSGLSLRVYDKYGIWKATANFSPFKELSEGYSFSNATYTVNLDKGFYYFTIQYGDIILAKSSMCNVVGGRGTSLIRYSDEENKVETIFDNLTYLEPTTGYEEGCYSNLPIKEITVLPDNETITSDKGTIYLQSYLGNLFLISDYNGTFHTTTGDIDTSSLEVASGVFKKAILIAENKNGYFESTEGYVTTNFQVNVAQKRFYFYSDNGFSFRSIMTNPYIETAIARISTLFYIFARDGYLFYSDISLSNVVFRWELYDNDNNLIQSNTINATGKNFIARHGLDGTYYLKFYESNTMLFQTVPFYTNGENVYLSNESEEGAKTYFYYRFEGGISPNGDNQKTNTSDFSDQEDEVIALHQNPYQTYTLTIGSNYGIGYHDREKLNILLSLDDLQLNGLPITKASEVKTFEAENIEETGNKILKVEIQPSVNNHAQTGEYVILYESGAIIETGYLTL